MKKKQAGLVRFSFLYQVIIVLDYDLFFLH